MIKTKRLPYFRLLLLLLLSASSIMAYGQIPTNPDIPNATVVNSFPYADINTNSSLAGANVLTQGGCNANCCSTMVYRVEIPPIPGTLRGDMSNFVPLAGSMLGYVPTVPNPTSSADLQHLPGPGNFCGFRDSLQINGLSGGEVIYVLVFSYNNQTSNGVNTDVLFDFIPDCPPGLVCGGFDTTICEAGPYISPSGNLYSASGSYTDTLLAAGQGGLDSLIYISLTIDHQSYNQDEIMDEVVCDTVYQESYTEMISYGHFDPSDQDWVEVNSVAPALAGTNRSVFTWMRQTTTVAGNSQMLVAINTSGGGNVCLMQIGTNEQFGVFDGANSRYTGVTVTDGLWHHVGYTYDEATNSTNMYVDGVLEGNYVNGQSSAANSQFSLGQEFDSGNSKGNFFEGEMTEVSIWNEVLDSTDIASLMQQAIKPSHPKYGNLIAYYPFIVDCEAPTEALIDFSPNGNDGLASSADIVLTDTLEPITGFNSSCHFQKEWSRGGNVISTADTLLYTPAIADTYQLNLHRAYFDVEDSWAVTIDLICDSCTNTSATIAATACGSYTVPSGNATYTSNGQYLDTIPNSGGCDSLLTINLTVFQDVIAHDTLTACDSAMINGNTYFSSQTVTDLFPAGAANGCDSTLVTMLTINQSVTTSQNLTACDSAVINGNTYFSSQTVTDVFAAGAANGCDSTLVTMLTINQSVTTSQNLTACDSAVINGNTYFSSQTVTDLFPAGADNGCDSTLVTNLTINQSVTTSQNLTACDSAVINGNTYFSSQTVTDLFPAGAANGCDSTLVTMLTINQSVTTSQNLTACDSTVINGNTYFSSQTVTDLFAAGAANGWTARS